MEAVGPALPAALQADDGDGVSSPRGGGPVIGLTGSVGTGKSTVAEIFRSLGARVLDADRITHALMRPGTAVHRKIRRAFGAGVITAAGRIDRRRLGQEVFRDPRRLRVLTGIVHPAVRREIKRRLDGIRRREPRRAVVLEIPLLMETGRRHYPVDATVVVSAPFDVAARRLRRHRGWTAAEVRRRQARQWPIRKKTLQADFVIDNGGSRDRTRRQAIRLWHRVRNTP